MGNERTFVGLDVHGWSVTVHAVDTVSGEVWQRKLTPDPADMCGWVVSLPGRPRWSVAGCDRVRPVTTP